MENFVWIWFWYFLGESGLFEKENLKNIELESEVFVLGIFLFFICVLVYCIVCLSMYIIWIFFKESIFFFREVNFDIWIKLWIIIKLKFFDKIIFNLV